MSNDLSKNSRSDYRAKRKKTNLVLNSLIILVLALIIIVAYNIFVSGDDDKASTTAVTPKQTEKQSAEKEPKEDTAKKEADNTKDTDADEDEDEDTSEEAVQEKESEEASTTEGDESQAVVSDGGSSSNVLKTIVNPAWEPVGTSQSGPHTASYDSTSVDWQEMLNAITYATGLDPSNMTVYWLGRDRTTTNASIGTVASKDKQQKYNVYIKWVDGEGWVPTKVEEIAEIVKP